METSIGVCRGPRHGRPSRVAPARRIDPVPTASTPRPRGRPGGGRERILDVACELIATQGMDDVRVARIARAAGVSTALVHYHFTTREALLGEALRHSSARAGAARTALLAGAGASSARLLAGMIEHCLPLPGR